MLFPERIILIIVLFLLFLDGDLIEALTSIMSELKFKVYVQCPSNANISSAFESLGDVVAQKSRENVDRSCRKSLVVEDCACYIFTSGTTGNDVINSFIPLHDYKVLFMSTMEPFAYNFIVAQMVQFLFERVENIVGKGENAGNHDIFKGFFLRGMSSLCSKRSDLQM